MPDRMIREDIITSDNVNKLSWLGQVFFYRLLLNIDNAARLDARPEIIRSKLFPLDNQKVSVADTVKLLSDCESAGLISTYEVGGKMFLVVKNFGQKLRFDTKSKYPPPPEEKRREEEVEEEIEVEDARATPFKKFNLRGKEIKQNAGEWLRENFEPRIDADFSTKYRSLDKETCLLEFTDEAFLKNFREENHIFNSFNSFCKGKLETPNHGKQTRKGHDIERVSNAADQVLRDYQDKLNSGSSEQSDTDISPAEKRA